LQRIRPIELIGCFKAVHDSYVKVYDLYHRQCMYEVCEDACADEEKNKKNKMAFWNVLQREIEYVYVFSFHIYVYVHKYPSRDAWKRETQMIDCYVCVYVYGYIKSHTMTLYIYTYIHAHAHTQEKS
jgi:hypothetical protein